jgi:hypothetical protein
MISTAAHIEVDRAIGDVFAFITDTTKTPLWQTGVIRIDGPPGMREGAVYEMETHFLGRINKSRFEVLENDGKGTTRAHSIRGPLKFETTQRCEETPLGRTRVTLEVKIDAGLVYKLAEPALESITKTLLEADLKTLKVVIEATL